MKKITVLAFGLTMLAGPVLAAQLYRSVDENGNVEWRDTPPPPTAKKVEQRNIGGNTIQTSELPYSLQQAVKNSPVTLWVTNCGAPCDKARAHLGRRGIPYSEKNAQSDVEGFKKASGGGLELPLLLVGSNKIKGYLESEWDAALDTAGYPTTAAVPVKATVAPAATAGAQPAPAPAATAPQAEAPQPAVSPAGYAALE